MKLRCSKPLMPAYAVTANEGAMFAARNNLHYCKNLADAPCDGLVINDCIEDLKGRYFLRTASACAQVTYCPICGKKAKSHV